MDTGGVGTKLGLETSTPAVMGDNWCKERVFIFEACFQILGDLTLGTSAEYFCRACFQEEFPDEELECDCLSHATIVEFLEPSLRVLLIYVQKERGREVVG